MSVVETFTLPFPQDIETALPALLRLSPYRYHRAFSSDELCAISRHTLEQQTRLASSAAFALRDAAGISGVCVVAPLPWDTEHFGLPMGRMDLHVASRVDESAIGGLVAEAIAACRSMGLRHVSTHIDLDDYAAMHALVTSGFRLRDIKRCYTIRRRPVIHGRRRGHFRPRAYRSDDRNAVLQLIDATRYQSRYTRDPCLPVDRSDMLYRLWTARMLDRPPEQRELVVVNRGTELVAFGGVQEIDFRAAGVDKRILGNAIVACSPLAVGAFVPIVMALAEGGLQRYPVIEAKISANNVTSARVQEYGGMETAASQYALHLWV